MSSCAAIDPLVTPFIDGELTDADLALVEQHIRVCAPCRSRVEAERSVCRLLRARQFELKTGAPEALQSRCWASGAHRVGALHSVSRRRTWSSRLSPMAMAAVVVLAVGGAVAYRATFGATQAIAAELTADHVKCLMLNAVLRTHDTVQDVQADMQSGFGWMAQLPEHPEREDLELIGSRPCLYEHGKIAHIMYRHKGLPVSVFMLPGERQAPELLQALGHDAVVWSDDRRTFVLIAKAPRADVERVAAFVRASLH